MIRLTPVQLLTGFVVVLASVVSLPTIAGASGGPSVSWTTTNDSTVSGKTSIDAVATPAASGTSTIDQWCLTSSGPPISAMTVGFTGPPGNYVTFNQVTGCWVAVDPTVLPINDASFSFDTTQLTNSTYTYQVTVTDSTGQTATSSVLSLTTNNGGPSVSWTTTNDSTVSGKTSIDAVATPAASGTSTIDQWCLTSSGPPISAMTVGFTGPPGNYVTFNQVTGCWVAVDPTVLPINDASFSFDTTQLTNSTYTYQVTVTDSSGRSATSAVLSLTTDNGGPSVSWTTASNSTVSGVTTFDAVATPAASGTSTIDQWCLTSSDTNIVLDGAEFTGNGYSDDNFVTYNDVTGCWTADDPANFPLTEASFDVDTTTAANGLVQLKATVTDSGGRSSEATLTFTSKNSGPSTSLTTANTAGVSGTIQLHANAAASSSGTATMSQVCLKVDGKPVSTDVSNGNLGTFSASSGCWQINGTDANGNPLTTVSDVLSIRTAVLHNGSHAFSLVATDSSGRTSSASLTISTSNPGAKVSSIRAVAITPAWNSASTRVSFWVYESNATKVILRYGTTTAMTSSRTVVITPHRGSPVLLTLIGLTQKTLIYYQVTVYGFNGNASSRVAGVRTKAIPPKAYVVSTTCDSQEYIGTSLYYGPYYYWIYYYVYHWSNGSVSESQTYESLGTTRPC